MKTKVLLLTVPAIISDAVLIEALTGALVKCHLNAEELSGFVLKQDEFIHILDGMGIKANCKREETKKKAREESPFMAAVRGVIDAIPDHKPGTPEFRAEFHMLALKGILARTMIECISIGPRSKSDLEFLRVNNAESIVDLAATSLSLIESING